MSVVVNYKGEEILSADTDITKTLKTSGKYCEGDIEIINTQDGGGDDFNPLLYVSGTHAEGLFFGATIPRVSHFTFGDITSLKQTFNKIYLESGSEESELKVSKVGSSPITNLNSAFNDNYTGTSRYKKLIVDFDTSHVTNWTSAFWGAAWYGLTEIVGILDFSSATNIADIFFNHSQNTLKEVRFAKNTLAISGVNLNVTPISDDSCVSIANGLSESAGAKTVGLPSKISTIIGTSTLDPTGTYHIFTADASGTMTLSEFITTVKGWTLV